MDRHVYLIGMPGSGKSSVGRTLAVLLGMPFVDLDREIEADAGAAIPVIFRRKGEEGFRQLESGALLRVARDAPAVVACGGGAPLRDDNRRLMHETGHVVWLNIPLASLRERVRDLIDSRPLVKEPLDLERLYHAREATYRNAADHEVAADADPATVARSILEVLT